MARLLANWFPLLLLALMWTLAAWYHRDFCLSISWSLCALGSAAYLITLAGFVFFGNHDRPVDASTRTATALAMGAAMIFAVYAWGKWPESTNPTGTVPTSAGEVKLDTGSKTRITYEKKVAPTPPNPTKPDGNDPLNSVNIFAAILGVVLTAVTLIAEKSAVDARAEAEKAKAEAKKAREDMHVVISETNALVRASYLLERAQAAKAEADKLVAEAYEIGAQDQDVACFLRLGADGLKRLARFFMYLHHWILEPPLTPTNDLVGMATKLILDLETLNRAAQTNEPRVRDWEQRLRAEYWQPAGRLIESLLVHGLPSSATPTEAEKVILKLQGVRAMLAQL